MKLVLLLAGLVVLLGAAGLALASALSKRPDDLGLRDGRLRPCPGTPNCACSEDRPAAGAPAVEPLSFTSAPAAAWQRARAALATLPRTVIDVDNGQYLHAECTSALFRFTDDVELRLDAAAGVIHVRSASRVGRSDFGANARRIAALRAAFEASGGG